LNKNLIPGSSFEQDIYLVQSTPNVDLNAAVSVSAGPATGWITIENGNNFVIPAGKQEFPMKVDIKVPQDAQNGEYKGTITVNTSPVGAQKSGVSINLGGNIKIDLTVSSNQISNFAVQNFQIPDVAKGSPINFMMKIKNPGNVASGPTSVSLTFFDQLHSKQLGQQTENVAQQVPPFQTNTISVQFPNSLDLGSYWADVKVYSNNNAVATDKLVFNVIAPSAAAKAAVPAASSSVIAWILIIAIIVIIVVVAIILKNRQKK
jgi:uncharacterized membrane protein